MCPSPWATAHRKTSSSEDSNIGRICSAVLCVEKRQLTALQFVVSSAADASQCSSGVPRISGFFWVFVVSQEDDCTVHPSAAKLSLYLEDSGQWADWGHSGHVHLLILGRSGNLERLAHLRAVAHGIEVQDTFTSGALGASGPLGRSRQAGYVAHVAYWVGP